MGRNPGRARCLGWPRKRDGRSISRGQPSVTAHETGPLRNSLDRPQDRRWPSIDSDQRSDCPRSL